MMKWINKWWPWVLCILFWAMIAFLLYSFRHGLRKENERLRQELAQAQQHVPLQRDTIRDSVEVVKQKIVEVERVKEVLSKEDRQLLKDLSMKVSEMESLQKIGSTISDTVVLSAAVQREPPLLQPAVASSPADTPLVYHDAWADFMYYVTTGRLAYSIRDSLAIAVKRRHKHKFLFLKWGTKGYEVNVISFNPHVSIRYNTYVKRKR